LDLAYSIGSLGGRTTGSFEMAPGLLRCGTHRIQLLVRCSSLAGFLYCASAALIAVSSRLSRGGDRRKPHSVPILISVALVLVGSASAVDLRVQWQTGLSRSAHAYGAAVYAIMSLQIFFVLTTLVMGLYTIALWIAGKLDSVRRTTFDNAMLFWFYTLGQGLVGLLVVHGFPRLTGGV
jgi:cytochrome c oxidase subunit I+III